MLKVAVIGLGRFGSTIARSLSELGAEVLAIDRSTRLVENLADEVAVAVGFDATDVANLKAYDVGSMDAAVVAIGTNFEASVLVAMHCKSLGVATVYAKALNPMQEEVLTKVGADQVVKPEEDMGLRLAEHLMNASVIDFVELPGGYSMHRVKIPEAWAEKSLADLDLLKTHRINLVQIRRPVLGADGEPEGIEKIPVPCGTEVLKAGDVIDVIGADKDLEILK